MPTPIHSRAASWRCSGIVPIPFRGGSNAQGSALALVDGSIIQVTLTQGNGLANADVEKMTGDLLKLAVSKL